MNQRAVILFPLEKERVSYKIKDKLPYVGPDFSKTPETCAPNTKANKARSLVKNDYTEQRVIPKHGNPDKQDIIEQT
jgi:hypothetical protein